MNKRINIVLPDTTENVLDRVATKGTRSRFIDRAVLHYVETQGRQSLLAHLPAGFWANAERDLAIAAEWFPLEEEAGGYPRLPKVEEARQNQKVMTSPREGRSLSGRVRSHPRPRDSEDPARHREPERHRQQAAPITIVAAIAFLAAKGTSGGHSSSRCHQKPFWATSGALSKYFDHWHAASSRRQRSAPRIRAVYGSKGLISVQESTCAGSGGSQCLT